MQLTSRPGCLTKAGLRLKELNFSENKVRFPFTLFVVERYIVYFYFESYCLVAQ